MSNRAYNSGELVTVALKDTSVSNTFIVDMDLGDDLLLFHPIAPNSFVKYPKSSINLVSSNIKDSTERNLDFCFHYKEYLDYMSMQDLESLSVLFALRRRLTKRQLQILAHITGDIAEVLLNYNLNLAMEVTVKNEAVLDEYNRRWYTNFRKIYQGKQSAKTEKQRKPIFNIAGFIMSQLENPSATNPLRRAENE